MVKTYNDGGAQQISLYEFITRVKNPGGGSKEKRRRRKNHNKNIGMKASLNAIWKALIAEKDEKNAEAAIARAKKNYGVEAQRVSTPKTASLGGETAKGQGQPVSW